MKDLEQWITLRVKQILEALESDSTEELPEEMADTPRRVTRFLLERFRPEPLPEPTLFDSDLKDMVIVRDIPFNAVCRHHLLPFFGSAHVAYVPKGKIIGLSKIPRLVEHCAKRPQTQESLVAEIADRLADGPLKPQGVFVTMSAEHLCLRFRGARCNGSSMVVSAIRGQIDKNEVLKSISMHGGK